MTSFAPRSSVTTASRSTTSRNDSLGFRPTTTSWPTSPTSGRAGGRSPGTNRRVRAGSPTGRRVHRAGAAEPEPAAPPELPQEQTEVVSAAVPTAPEHRERPPASGCRSRTACAPATSRRRAAVRVEPTAESRCPSGCRASRGTRSRSACMPCVDPGAASPRPPPWPKRPESSRSLFEPIIPAEDEGAGDPAAAPPPAAGQRWRPGPVRPGLGDAAAGWRVTVAGVHDQGQRRRVAVLHTGVTAVRPYRGRGLVPYCR